MQIRKHETNNSTDHHCNQTEKEEEKEAKGLKQMEVNPGQKNYRLEGLGRLPLINELTRHREPIPDIVGLR